MWNCFYFYVLALCINGSGTVNASFKTPRERILGFKYHVQDMSAGREKDIYIYTIEVGGQSVAVRY